MAGPTIGTIRGTIEIDYDGKGIIRAKDDVDQLDKKSVGTQASLNKMATGLAAVGGVIAAGFAVATASAISFEKQMSAVKAVSGASTEQMQRLTDKALELGAKTKFSASEAALALEELVKAGLSVEEVLNGAADATVALAAAGEIDLASAATIAANALNQFNLKASDLTGVVDTIAGAANASAIDVHEFGLSLSQVGAVANLAGQDFDQVATAIALLGNAGIKGSDAGTSLKTMLSNLVPTTGPAIKAFKELGLNVGASGNAFIDAQGNYKSLADISGILNTATKGLSESQKQVALETIFGSDAIRAAAIIANTGAEGFAALNAEMHKTTAAEVAATRMDNAAGSIEQLKGSVETLGIAIGSRFTPVLQDVVDKITIWVNAFGELDKGTQGTILAIVGIVGALSLLLAAVIKITQAFLALRTAITIIKAWVIWSKIAAAMTKIWAGVQWLLAAAMNATFLIVILVIAVIALLVAAIIWLWKNNETFRKVVMAVWSAIKKAIAAVVDWFVNTAWPALKKVWEAILSIWDLIAPIVKAAFAAWISAVQTAWAIISAIFAVIVAVVKAVWGFIGPYIIGAVKLWWDYVTFVWNALVTITTFVFNLIKSIIVAVWGFIGPYVMTVVKGIWDIITKVWGIIWAVTQKIWGDFKAFFVALWQFLVALFDAAVQTVVNIFTGIKVILDKVKGFFNELKTAANGGTDTLIAFVKGIPGRILDGLGNLGAMLFDSGKKMIQGLIDGISSMVGKAKDTLSNLLKSLRNLLPFSPAKEGPFSGKGWTFNSGTALIEDFARGIERASATSLDSMMGAVSGVSASFAPGTPSTTAPTSTTTTNNTGGVTHIGTVAVNGVWDFTDPMATRKMVAELDKELTNYQNGFK
jgi:TP901 family phage tail tape measure protein